MCEETKLAKADFPKRCKKLIRLLKAHGLNVLGHLDIVKHLAFKTQSYSTTSSNVINVMAS